MSQYIRYCADIKFKTGETAEAFSKEDEIKNFFTDIKFSGNSVKMTKEVPDWKEEKECEEVLRGEIGKTLKKFKGEIKESEFQIHWLGYGGITHIKLEEILGEVIQVFRPSMTQEEIDAVTEVLKSGWIGLGPKTKKFEKEFAEYIGAKHVIGLNSATAGLHLAVKAFGITSGEIIVPAITFVSTAFAASYNNCTPIFADVYEDTLNIDVDDIKRKITPKTRAIIPVHFGGHAAKMDEINEIANEHGLKVIEDAAHAVGATYKGRKVGTLADMGVFSFHAVKNIGTGDGGAIVTNDDAIDERLRKLRWCGINKSTFDRSGKSYSWYYEVDEVGWKFHMNDIIAAIASVQLKRLEETNRKRRKIAEIYKEEFQGLDWMELPVEKDYVKSSFHNFVVKVEKRDEFMEFLNSQGISTGVHYMPLHMHPVFRSIKADVPVAERVWTKLVTLPMYPDLTEDEIRKITTAVKRFRK